MPRILFIDDDPLALMLLEKTAMLYNCDALTSISGKAAIEIAGREQPDMVVVDMQMNDMDGLTVIQKLKQEPVTAQIPAVILTAGPTLDVSKLAREAGAAACLYKPVNFEDLIRILEGKNGPAPQTRSTEDAS